MEMRKIGKTEKTEKIEKTEKTEKTEKSRSPAREAGDWRSGTQAVWPPQWLLLLSDNNTI